VVAGSALAIDESSMDVDAAAGGGWEEDDLAGGDDEFKDAENDGVAAEGDEDGGNKNIFNIKLKNSCVSLCSMLVGERKILRI
jgi:hypothetical protein